MFFWKLDEETIRCLIGKREIDDMGYNLKELTENSDLMGEFLDHIVHDSHKYIEWNTENGVQTYVARSLPGEQFLFTISCTYVDESINRDLDQIKRMTQELTQTVTPERIDEIYNLTGEEKEKAFHELTMDLHSVYNGSADNNSETPDEDAPVSGETPKEAVNEAKSETKKTVSKSSGIKSFIFKNFDDLVRFSCVVENVKSFKSSLYKMNDEYHLVVDFSDCNDRIKVPAFMIMAEEYGAKLKDLNYGKTYLSEHGTLMIPGQTLEVLKSLKG